MLLVHTRCEDASHQLPPGTITVPDDQSKEISTGKAVQLQLTPGIEGRAQ